MATFRPQQCLCSHPRQLEARLHELHLLWAIGQQALEAEEQGLICLQRHQAQLRWVVQDENALPARVVVTKLAQVEEQIAQSQRRLADQQQCCDLLASQFGTVQLALGAMRRQARKPRWTGSAFQQMGRLLHLLARLTLQGLQDVARSEVEWLQHGWYGW